MENCALKEADPVNALPEVEGRLGVARSLVQWHRLDPFGDWWSLVVIGITQVCLKIRYTQKLGTPFFVV